MNKIRTSANDTRYNKTIAPPLPTISFLKNNADHYSAWTPKDGFSVQVERDADGLWYANDYDFSPFKTYRAAAKAAYKEYLHVAL